jgi:hypothetical protein
MTTLLAGLPLTNPPCGATFSTATPRCDVLTTPVLEDALVRVSQPPRCVLDRGRPRPEPTPNTPTRATLGRPSSRHSRDLKNSDITSPR